jgi:hypothetical protein
MANRQTLLCWQVIRLLKNNGYFWLKFTVKMLHNLLCGIEWQFEQPRFLLMAPIFHHYLAVAENVLAPSA